MNRLSGAKSPYLLQHRSNPVDWYPWGPEAFGEARKRDVPVFLSIGYATCHWCHVMEHESFEDQEVAALMNRHFVSVKVDREERPDIDDVYMTVCHLMGKQGGWPLTVLLTPDKKPFFVATYLPKTSRHGRMGMMDFVPRVGQLWTEDRAGIENSAHQIVSGLALETASKGPGSGEFQERWLHEAYRQLLGRYDATHGGFGAAPKFPSPHNLAFLFAYGRVLQEPQALKMGVDTIVGMWRGGVFDQVGYGFHRYSTDVEWKLPHFEKMLHDQALMLDACVAGWLATSDERLPTVAEEIASYVIRDLRHPNGAYYSAEDADSEGEEGVFYLWTQDELSPLVSNQSHLLEWFGVEPAGNFADEATRERTGTNVLHPGPLAGKPPADLARVVELLRAERSKRPRPLRDEKVLLDWNGLMIGAMAKAGRHLNVQRFVDSAREAHSFLHSELFKDGQWLHRWFDGNAAVPAMLDDYAYFGTGLIELFLATSESQFLEEAIAIAQAMIEHCDAPDGGFYLSSSRGEELLVRKQNWHDGALLAGVSAAMDLLLRLDAITGQPPFAERASRLMAVYAESRHPSSLTGFLRSSASVWAGSSQVIVVTDADDDPLLREALASPLIGGFVLRLPTDGDGREALNSLIPAIRDMDQVDGRPAAYLCHNYRCELPVTDTKSLRAAMCDAEARV